MSNYYLTVLVKQDMDEKERNSLFESIKKSFEKLSKEDIWGSRDLAYHIKHQPKAFYAHFEFEGEPSKIPSLDKTLKLNEDIVRYLLLQVK